MTGTNPVATDEAVRSEIIETVRRFVANEVVPVAADLERTDTFPADIVEQMQALGLFGVTIPERYGGLGLDLLTYIGVIEELAYGWMSLTGIVQHAHHGGHADHDARHRRAEATLAPGHGHRASGGARCRSPSPMPAATPGTSRAGRSATATSTSSTAPRPG